MSPHSIAERRLLELVAEFQTVCDELIRQAAKHGDFGAQKDYLSLKAIILEAQANVHDDRHADGRGPDWMRRSMRNQYRSQAAAARDEALHAMRVAKGHQKNSGDCVLM